MAKERNTFVDLMRGIAMLLVVLGHTMTGSTQGSQNSFVFNVIWSLQMPLFILISGYVTRYSAPITDFKALLKFLWKRTLSYLLPFSVWSFLVRGLILGQKSFLDIKYMLWHMDSGYWFLITIWTISVVFGISSYVSSFIKSTELGKQALLFVSYVFGMALLGVIGYFAGMSFFGIKLTLYYMPFYFLGYLYGQYRDKIFSCVFGKTAVDITVALCFATWITALLRFNLYEISDSGTGIIIRASASLLGCIAVCGLVKGVVCKGTNERCLSAVKWAGVHSLEIYLTHYLLLSMITLTLNPVANSPIGIVTVAINYIVTIAVTAASVKLINANKSLAFCLYGKVK